ncbi:MAG: hypothetical protein PHV32_02745 [Eubacteriales bacterium]|nr:hypothetical protein [Eubacteriales bacterium]
MNKKIIDMSDFQEGLNKITLQKNYERVFKEYYENALPGMDMHDEGFASLDEAEAANYISCTAEEFIEKEKQKLAAIRKWNRGMALFSNAMLFVTYLIPALVQYDKPSTIALADAVIARWNSEFPKNKIQRSDYASVFSGYSTGLLSDLFRTRKY